jgi:hypothetical protein
MSRWNRKQLVLDASIALGSNDQMFNPAGDIAGDRNRKCLQAVWEEEHVAVFNSQLQKEWRKHASPYAATWLQNMTRKGRTMVAEGDGFTILLEPACRCQASDAQRAALKKDFHLVQSALATGQLILSNETRFPRYIANACRTAPELLELHFGGPAIEGEACRLWIKAGAEKERERRIDAWAGNPHLGRD